MVGFLPIIAISFSIFIIYTANPIFALICLIIVTFHLVFLLLSQGIEFLSLVLLIVYIGAISILFLFIIMMFNLQDLVHNYISKKKNKVDLIILVLWWQPIVQLYYIFTYKINSYLFMYYYKLKNINYYYYNELKALNNVFYTYYDLNFLVCGCLLFVAMLGAIILALITI